MARAGTAAIPTPYDFRRPNKFNRDHQRALQIAAETFARQLTTTLSTSLRAVTQVSVGSISQFTYDEYIRDVPNPTYLAVLSLQPLSGSSLLHLPLPLVMTSIERLLGGQGYGPHPERALTDIEGSLTRGLLTKILRELAYAFESLAAIQPELLQQESNPQFAQVASATDTVVVLSFDVRLGGTTGVATLCVPFSSLQPVLEEAVQQRDAGRVTIDPAELQRALGTSLGDAAVTVAVRFDPVTLSSVDIVDLRPGDVLTLHHPVDKPLSVEVGGVERFAAIAGRRGKRLACVLVDPATNPRSGDE